MKDAGVNADFPETYELEIPAAHFTNNLSVKLRLFLINSSKLSLTTEQSFLNRLSLRLSMWAVLPFTVRQVWAKCVGR